MRFTPGGPRVPNALLEARDAGEVALLCGAGVSIPAGLPDFFELTCQVAERLGCDRNSTVARLLDQQKQRRSVQSSSVEKPESVSLDRVFSDLVQTFGIEQVETEVLKTLTVRTARLDNHRALLDLATADGTCRLVTTNFDRLFERARPKLRTYAFPRLPDLAIAREFDGVVHLHGVQPRRSERYASERARLVLTGADFGNAYLADGWATRFVSALMSKYVVLLVGYSADDPPVRYLLEGLNAEHRGRAREVYALVAGDQESVAADWRERGVTAIAYDSTNRHDALWTTIHAWAERSRDSSGWRKKVASLARSSPANLRSFERGQVAALCSTLDGARDFAAVEPKPPAEWLCVFDAGVRLELNPRAGVDGDRRTEASSTSEVYLLDDDLESDQQRERLSNGFRGVHILGQLSSDPPQLLPNAITTSPNPYWFSLSPRLSILAQWIVASIEEAATIQWAGGRTSIHPEIRKQIAWRLNQKVQNLDTQLRTLWRYILEAHSGERSNVEVGWWSVKDRVRADGWNAPALREFARVTKPRLIFSQSWHRWWTTPEVDEWQSAIPFLHFDVHFPASIQSSADVPDEAVGAVARVLGDSLEIATELELGIDGYHRPLPTLYPEDKPGERYLSDADKAFLRYSELVHRLCEIAPQAAKAELRRRTLPSRYFLPIELVALVNREVFSAAEVRSAIASLSREDFWDEHVNRELLWLLRARWPDLPSRDRQHIESRLLEGRERYSTENELEFVERRAFRTAIRLRWMANQGMSLHKRTIKSLSRITSTLADWQDEWASNADSGLDMRSGWVKVETDTSSIGDLPLVDVIQRCEQLSLREEMFTERDPFQGLVTKYPGRAVAVMRHEHRSGHEPAKYLKKLFRSWPSDAPDRDTISAAKLLMRLSDDAVRACRFEAYRWLGEALSKLDRTNRDLFEKSAERAVGILETSGAELLRSALGKTSVGGIEQPSSRMGTDYAINSPTGHLASGLLDTAFVRIAIKKQAVPTDIRSFVERLVKLPGEGGAHALTVVSSRLADLVIVDAKWIEEFFLPYFEPSSELAEAAWGGYLHSARLVPRRFFDKIKSSFLLAFPASTGWTARGVEALGQKLLLALRSDSRRHALLSVSEGRAALRSASEAVRLEAVSRLARESSDKRWLAEAYGFFRNVWPRERSLQSPATSREIVTLLLGLDERFPDAVDQLAPLLLQLDHVDGTIADLRRQGRRGSQSFVQRYPRSVLRLVSRIVDRGMRRPYGLDGLLDELAQHDSLIRRDSHWRALAALTL